VRRALLFAVTGLALVAGTASGAEEKRVERAAQYGGQGWSLLGGQTVGGGANVLLAQLGYPGISVGYVHGVTPSVDLGFRAGFNYGYEGFVTVLVPGVRGEFGAKFQLVDTGRFSLGASAGVGVFSYFGQFSSVTGVTLPVGIAFGIPIASALQLSLNLDAPLFVTFGPSGGLTFPLLFGVGLEYFIDRNFAATFATRMGPAINPTGYRYGSRSEFDFHAHLGVAYKL
jgi:hypothetical protein